MNLFKKRNKAAPQPPKFRVDAGRRIYAVGDIHGRKDLLSRLMNGVFAAVGSSGDLRSQIVFLGDYVDRGPDSAGVLSELWDLQRQLDVVLLKGNHEALLLDFLRDPETLPFWAAVGGLPTLTSYGLTPSLRPTPDECHALQEALLDSMPPAHLSLLQGLRLSHAVDDYFFAHAGVRPGVALDRQDEQDLLWIRDEFLSYKGFFEKRIVHGHTPIQHPDVQPHRINIDTGAFATGQLTCLVLEGDQVRFLA